jgi:hypothetical protein
LYAQTLEIFEAYKVYHRLSRIRLKYGELVTPRTGLMPFSDRPDSDANHRNLENWWSAEFSAAWAYTPCVRFGRRDARDTRYRAARRALPGRDLHPLDRASFPGAPWDDPVIAWLWRVRFVNLVLLGTPSRVLVVKQLHEFSF